LTYVRAHPPLSADVRYHIMVSVQMNSKHRRTLEAIFTRPVPSDIRWADIEALLLALGAERSEGRGSRVRLLLNGVEAVFHRPHPRPETNRGAVVSMREYLKMAGIEP
jgi:hypothetical protein